MKSYQYSIAIPVYQPEPSFFNLLENLQKLTENVEIVVLHTINNFESRSSNEVLNTSRLKSMSHVYGEISRSEFQHGSSRNKMVEMCNSDYVIFITQDIKINSNNIFSQVISFLNENNLDAVCLRHKPLNMNFQAIFDNMFSALAHIDYVNCKWKEIAWWSNNFALYKKSFLIEFPFPNIDFAEDLYWAKFAKLNRARIDLMTSQFIMHQNQDSFLAAYKRGKTEAIGHMQGRDFLYLHTRKESFIVFPIIALLRNIRTDLSRVKLISVILNLNEYLRVTIQLMSKSFHVNRLIRKRVI